MIAQLVQTDRLASFLRTTAPAVVAANPGKTTLDIWRAYLRSLSVVGGTQHDIEQAFLTQQLVPTGKKLTERYVIYGGGTNVSASCKGKFK